MPLKEVCRELAEMVAEGLERDGLQDAKRRLARSRSLDRFPSNPEVLEAAEEMELGEEVRSVLVKKPSRGLSGVSVVAVMTSPAECPHGRCGMCPGGPSSGTPQSYTGREPAARRGADNGYDPFDQVESRVEQLESSGHPVDKVELIVMGGTFTSRERGYRRDFVRACFDALNGSESVCLDEAHRLNETGGRRCVGMTLETRPDEIAEESALEALDTGFTRVELGAQTLNDGALERMERGHTTRDLRRASALMRDLGFKVCYHWMPGFPGVDRGEEEKLFEELFTEPYQPDALKVYPTLVIEGTELHRDWREGRYRPMGDDGCAELVASLLERVPPWVRVNRVMRDIPSTEVAAGPTATNMRQLAWDRMEGRGTRCRCVRCREVGRSDAEVEAGAVELLHRSFRASGGREHFLSFEQPDRDVLVGLLRMREPADPVGMLDGCAVVRELHVYGKMVPVGTSGPGWQHRSFGRRLMSEAERVAREEGFGNLCVISGVGAREYYRALGYSRRGPYMARSL